MQEIISKVQETISKVHQLYHIRSKREYKMFCSLSVETKNAFHLFCVL